MALLFEAMALAPAAVLAQSGHENRVVNYHAVERAGIENLQRWVAAGHEAWLKDPRLVAAEDLRRIAADFPDRAAELNLVDPAKSNGGAKSMTFEWTPADGGATYRVTVEQFDWLLPIAKQADAVVWVPTMTEVELHD